MSQTILTTGGTGYVGSWVVKGLLEKGHTVRVATRDKSRADKYQFLVDLAAELPGTLEIWEADLLAPGGYDEAAKGADAIVHMASPFFLNPKNPQTELVDPALKGTENVLEAANRSGSVKKVVLTSSVVAVYGDNVDMTNQGLSAFTEEHFNTTSSLDHQPYNFSKVLAEKKAWEMAEQADWDLVVMNPSFVMGPPLSKNSKSESLNFMNNLLTGKMKTGVPELNFGFVDVRDVAYAHIYGLENEAEGRHILCERTTSMMDFANIIREQTDVKKGLPSSKTPKWLAGLIGPLFGLTRKYVKNNVGYPVKLDNRKSIEKLQLNYTPLEQTVKDMVAVMR